MKENAARAREGAEKAVLVKVPGAAGCKRVGGRSSGGHRSRVSHQRVAVMRG